MWLVVKLLAVLAGLGIYGAGVEPRFVVQNHERAVIPNLPAAWEGKEVAVLADMHVGMWWANHDALRRATRDVVTIHPAMVLLAGDFVYDADSSADSQMAIVVAILQPILDAHIPVYAVLGNHDYSLMNAHSDEHDYVAVKVSAALQNAGVRMLDNHAWPLSSSALPQPRPMSGPAPDAGDLDPPLYLVGVGERWAKNDHPIEALAEIPSDAPRILFMHDPDSFAQIPAGEAPFAVAAHTHAMQLVIPLVSPWIWRHYFTNQNSTLEGWSHDYGQPGNHLYVNRGLGFSIVPARINAVPEVTVFTLTRGP